jgi:hypothetical protein
MNSVKSAVFWDIALGLFLDPEDGGDTFFRKLG